MLASFKFVNFGDSIINWIKLFNTEVNAAVNQSGHLSDFSKYIGVVAKAILSPPCLRPNTFSIVNNNIDRKEYLYMDKKIN